MEMTLPGSHHTPVQAAGRHAAKVPARRAPKNIGDDPGPDERYRCGGEVHSHEQRDDGGASHGKHASYVLQFTGSPCVIRLSINDLPVQRYNRTDIASLRNASISRRHERSSARRSAPLSTASRTAGSPSSTSIGSRSVTYS